MRSLQEKVDQLEAALDRLRKEVQEAEDEEMAQRKAADQLKEDVASLKARLVTCAPLINPVLWGAKDICNDAASMHAD